MLEQDEVPKETGTRQIRQSLDLSQSQFAALMHVSVKTLRNWEQGARARRRSRILAQATLQPIQPPWQVRRI